MSTALIAGWGKSSQSAKFGEFFMIARQLSHGYACTFSKAFKELSRHWGAHWSLYVLLLLYAATRLLYIEMDLPPWERMTYQTVDELYYAQPAYEWLRADRVNFEHLPFNLVQNVIVVLSVLTFGWSYSSIRMGSFVLGGVGLILVYLACLTLADRRNLKAHLTRNVIFIFSGLILVFNVAFYYATIVLEPSIAVATYSAAIILAVSRYQNKPTLIGALTLFGPLFVYPYAVIYSTGSIIAIVWLSWKNGVNYFLKASLGGVIVLFAFFITAAISNPNSLSEFFSTTATQGSSRLINVMNYPLGYLLEQYFLNDIPRINIFRHSTLALPLFMVSLLVALFQITTNRKKTELVLIVVLLIIGARFSFLFIEKTHFERKMSDISLALLFLLFYSFTAIYSYSSRFIRAEGMLKKNWWKALVMIGASFLIIPEAKSLRIEMIADKRYNNRDELTKLGRYVEDCTVAGEWGLGLNIYGKYKTKLNPYRYLVPESYVEYSDSLLQLVQKPDVVVVSSMPPSPKMSDNLKKQLVPIYQFPFNDGGKQLSTYAVYIPKARQQESAPLVPCQRALR